MNHPRESPDPSLAGRPSAKRAVDRPCETIDSSAIDRLQRAMMHGPAEPQERAQGSLLDLVVSNHTWNRLLWAEEDQARRLDVPDAELVKNKRAIDRYNQYRNDAIEAIDEWLLRNLQRRRPRHDAWLNSETAGSIIDRLSINLLKLHHMGLQAERREVLPGHRERCMAKLPQLQSQRGDLLGCLQRLIDGLADGHCHFRIYRQFKMYNDPTLNPCLYGHGTQ